MTNTELQDAIQNNLVENGARVVITTWDATTKMMTFCVSHVADGQESLSDGPLGDYLSTVLDSWKFGEVDTDYWKGFALTGHVGIDLETAEEAPLR